MSKVTLSLSEMDYTLTGYSPAIRDAYLSLLPELDRDVARGKLEWKFRDNPHGSGLIATAMRDGEVVGVNAFMAVRCVIEGRQVRGYQSMDTIVSPKARGQGVFGKLINCFYEHTDAGFLYGFPNESSSPGFFGKLGWTAFGPVPMLVRPLRTGYFLRKLFRNGLDWRLPVFSRSGGTAERVTCFSEDMMALGQPREQQASCLVERDAAYLNWRLFDHPAQDYLVLKGRGGAFTAALTATEKHGARIGYLMEAVGEPGELAMLVGESLRAMQRDGAELAMAWSLPWSPNYRALRRAGFVPFPPRFRPIVINFGARDLKSNAAAAGERANWYISYLDSDTV